MTRYERILFFSCLVDIISIKMEGMQNAASLDGSACVCVCPEWHRACTPACTNVHTQERVEEDAMSRFPSHYMYNTYILPCGPIRATRWNTYTYRWAIDDVPEYIYSYVGSSGRTTPINSFWYVFLNTQPLYFYKFSMSDEQSCLYKFYLNSNFPNCWHTRFTFLHK